MDDFTALPDLASRALGGSVVAANDELFAERENLVTPAAPEFSPRTFGPKGQVYDGWETRRRRTAGHDHAIVRLGVPGVVRGVVVDTAFFTGNYPPAASVEGCGVEGHPSPAELADADWFDLVPRAALRGDEAQAFVVEADRRVTHVRLSIYPDGGVARLRVHGEAVPDPRLLPGGLDGAFDLAALEHGGLVTGCSNMFYSSPNNLLFPGLAAVMGDGWETARRRDDGNDWVTVRLAAPGTVTLAELDTSHFKGNAPGSASLSGIDARQSDLFDRPDPDDPASWFELLPRTRLQPDTRHRFRVPSGRAATHVRLDVYPDGGMARLRLYGRLGEAERGELLLRWANLLPAEQLRAVLHDAGMSGEDAERLARRFPLSSAADLPPPLRP
jgi:allantoicase